MNIEDIKANKPDDELQALINATDDMVRNIRIYCILTTNTIDLRLDFAASS